VTVIPAASPIRERPYNTANRPIQRTYAVRYGSIKVVAPANGMGTVQPGGGSIDVQKSSSQRPGIVQWIQNSLPWSGTLQNQTNFRKILTLSASICNVRLVHWLDADQFPPRASVEDARERLAYELYYVKNRLLLLDAIVLLSTARVVL
jgi:hypothetical protein